MSGPDSVLVLCGISAIMAFTCAFLPGSAALGRLVCILTGIALIGWPASTYMLDRWYPPRGPLTVVPLALLAYGFATLLRYVSRRRDAEEVTVNPHANQLGVYPGQAGPAPAAAPMPGMPTGPEAAVPAAPVSPAMPPAPVPGTRPAPAPEAAMPTFPAPTRPAPAATGSPAPSGRPVEPAPSAEPATTVMPAMPVQPATTAVPAIPAQPMAPTAEPAANPTTTPAGTSVAVPDDVADLPYPTIVARAGSEEPGTLYRSAANRSTPSNPGATHNSTRSIHNSSPRSEAASLDEYPSAPIWLPASWRSEVDQSGR